MQSSYVHTWLDKTRSHSSCGEVVREEGKAASDCSSNERDVIAN